MLYFSSTSNKDYDEDLASGSQIEQRKKKMKYVQQYKKEWEKEFNWICAGKKQSEAMCKVCVKTLSITSGKLQLVRHQDTTLHRNRSKSSYNQQTLTNYLKDDNSEKVMKKADLYISAFVAEHNLPFAVCEHLPKLVSKINSLNFENGRDIKCGRTKTTAIIKNVIGGESLHQLCMILRKVKFSLIADESTDLTCTKHLALVVRYFYNNK